MKKIVIGLIALATLASPVLARDYQRAGNMTYSTSSKMRGADTMSANASYAAAHDANSQRERDRAEALLSR